MTTWNLPTYFIPPMGVEDHACCRLGVEMDIVCANPECRKTFTVPVREDKYGTDWELIEQHGCPCGTEDFIRGPVSCCGCGSGI